MFDLKKKSYEEKKKRKQDLDSPQMIEANKKKLKPNQKQVQI